MKNAPEDKAAGLISLAAMVVCVPLDGWALANLWQWFVVPLGARPIGVAHGVGLFLLAHLVPHSARPRADTPEERLERAWQSAIGNVAMPFLLLLMGLVARAMM